MAKYTEAKKKNNQKWDKENLRRGAYAMQKELYIEFEKYCVQNNISKNAMINKCIADAIGYTVNMGENQV